MANNVQSLIGMMLPRLKVVEISIPDAGNLVVVFAGDNACFGEKIFAAIEEIHWNGNQWSVRYDQLAAYARIGDRAIVTYKVVSGPTIVPGKNTTWSNPTGVVVWYRVGDAVKSHQFP